MLHVLICMCQRRFVLVVRVRGPPLLYLSHPSPSTLLPLPTSQRPPGTHGCKMVEVVPGIYNAHFNDLDKPDSIEKINQTLTRKITMVVNR